MHQLAREIWRYETPLPVRARRSLLLRAALATCVSPCQGAHGRPVVSGVVRAYGISEPYRSRGCGRQFHPPFGEGRSPTVVFLGRLIAAKRPDDAVDAFRILRAAVPDARMWVIGDGPRLDELRRANPPGVELLGYVSQEERTRRLAASPCPHHDALFARAGDSTSARRQHRTRRRSATTSRASPTRWTSRAVTSSTSPTALGVHSSTIFLRRSGSAATDLDIRVARRGDGDRSGATRLDPAIRPGGRRAGDQA